MYELQVVSQNQSGLIAKFYYTKRKIVWEILDGSLKSKIELLWSDIIGINAVLHDKQSGILELEVDIFIFILSLFLLYKICILC